MTPDKVCAHGHQPYVCTDATKPLPCPGCVAEALETGLGQVLGRLDRLGERVECVGREGAQHTDELRRHLDFAGTRLDQMRDQVGALLSAAGRQECQLGELLVELRQRTRPPQPARDLARELDALAGVVHDLRYRPWLDRLRHQLADHLVVHVGILARWLRPRTAPRPHIEDPRPGRYGMGGSCAAAAHEGHRGGTL